MIPMGGIMIEADQVATRTNLLLLCAEAANAVLLLMHQLEHMAILIYSNLKGGILAWQAEIDPTISVY
jgi:rhodanese-related sulfurtransferase